MSETKELEFVWSPAQAAFVDHPARFKILAKGRRFGATQSCAQFVIREMLDKPNYKVLWVDVTYSNITRYYNRCFQGTLESKFMCLSKLPRALYSWKEQQKQLNFSNGSYLDMRSADRPESLEGFAYNLIVLNEAGIILKNRELWTVSIAPQIADYSANVLFVGTPKGKIDKHDRTRDCLYYELYKQGCDSNQTLWKSFQYSSYENSITSGGFIKEEEIEIMEDQLPPAVRPQEIGGQFINIAEDPIFYEEWFEIVDKVPDSGILVKVMSCDTAFKTKDESDYSAFIIIYQTVNAYYVVDVVNDKFEFPELLSAVKEAYDQYRPDALLIEDRASGQSLIQALQANTTFPIRPISPDKDKITRATAVTPLCEARKIKLVKGYWNKMFINQLVSFPEGSDDMVDSFSMACTYLKDYQGKASTITAYNLKRTQIPGIGSMSIKNTVTNGYHSIKHDTARSRYGHT